MDRRVHLCAHVLNIVFPPARDNRALVDDNTSQKLNADDVASLADRADGYTLIAELCKGSATFKGKTKYSQEKYIKKKAMKYHLVFFKFFSFPFLS